MPKYKYKNFTSTRFCSFKNVITERETIDLLRHFSLLHCYLSYLTNSTITIPYQHYNRQLLRRNMIEICFHILFLVKCLKIAVLLLLIIAI